MIVTAGLPAQVALCVRHACRLDVLAFKPGNVSVFSEGHGMRAEDFFRSAEAVANVIANSGPGVGLRVRAAVDATWEAVGCNTNLGILLLSAPLVESVLAQPSGGLLSRLQATLGTLNHEDTRNVFSAIRVAKPAGLGADREHDVNEDAKADLLTVMTAAARRDRIAYQYAFNFVDIFDIGLQSLQALRTRWREHAEFEAWALVGCYLRFLSTIPDTHIRRKFGPKAAVAVMTSAKKLESEFKSCENPRDAMLAVQAFDKKLKREGLNPGTSADLAVVTQLAFHLDELCANVRPSRTASSPEAA